MIHSQTRPFFGIGLMVALVAAVLAILVVSSGDAEAYPWSAHECETVSASFAKLPLVGSGGFNVKLSVGGKTYYGEVHDEWWRTSRLVHFHGAHVPLAHTQGYSVRATATVSFRTPIGISWGGSTTDSLVHYHDAWRGNDCSLGTIPIAAR